LDLFEDCFEEIGLSPMDARSSANCFEGDDALVKYS
jgi:hypothetical protein